MSSRSGPDVGSTLTRSESPAEARNFTSYVRQATREGLCPERCAPQAAYGRQHGWRQVHQPCDSCLDLARVLYPRWVTGSPEMSGTRVGPLPVPGNAVPGVSGAARGLNGAAA